MFQISKYLQIKPNSNNLVARQINPSFSVFYDHWFVLPPLTFLHKQKTTIINPSNTRITLKLNMIDLIYGRRFFL